MSAMDKLAAAAVRAQAAIIAREITDELAYRALLNLADDNASVEDTVAHEQQVESDVAIYITERLTPIIAAQEQRLGELERALGSIDSILSRRDALDDLSTGEEKILRAINTAKQVGPLEALTERQRKRIEQQEQRIAELQKVLSDLVQAVIDCDNQWDEGVSQGHLAFIAAQAALENSKPPGFDQLAEVLCSDELDSEAIEKDMEAMREQAKNSKPVGDDHD